MPSTPQIKTEKELLKALEILEEKERYENAYNNFLDYCKLQWPGYMDPRHIKFLASKLEAVERGEITRLAISLPPRHGKLAANTTLVCTTNGWKRHGDLVVGDYVYGPDGKPTRVIGVSDEGVANVEVEFNNGAVIKVHPNHEWTVFCHGENKYKTVETRYFYETSKTGRPRKLTSGEIGKRGGRYRYLIDRHSALEFSDQDLPIDPYVLGAWLGDGSSAKASICYAEKDREVISACVAGGADLGSSHIHKTTGVHYQGFLGLRKHLRLLGLLNNKHIPDIYKWSSIKQRKLLLAGIVDTDGHVEEKTGRIRIATCSAKLRDDIVELCRSLGFLPYVYTQAPCMSSSGIQGRSEVYYVGFQPDCDLPTAVERKRVGRTDHANRRIAIVDVREAEPEPGKCIQVDREDGLYLVGKELVATHNSQLTSEFFPAWYLGRNPSNYVIEATYAQELADDFGRKVRNQLRDEDLYQKVFPNVGFSGDSQSARRFNTTSGGSYFAVGAGGPITGRGAHLLIIDDIIKGREDADSETQRKNIIDWYKSVAYTRLMPGGAIVIIGTRWHEEDLIGWVTAESTHENWEVINIPAIATEKNDPIGRKIGEALWPEAYPLDRLEEIKETLGSRDWSALFQQSPSAEDGNIFRRPWFNIWDERDPPNCDYIIQSYDTAFSESKSADYSAIETWGVFRRDGKPGVILLSCVNERLDYPRLREKAISLYKEWEPDSVLIEKKASGQSLIQDLRMAGIPVSTYNPDRDKVTRAYAAAPLVESGYVWLPKKFWADEFINQCTAFPNGRRKDMVDAFTQVMIRLKEGYFLQHPDDPEDEEDRSTVRRRGYW